MVYIFVKSQGNYSAVPLGSDLDSLFENQQVLGKIAGNVDSYKLALDRHFSLAGIDPKNVNHQVLYYAIACGIYETVKVSLDITKDLNKAIENDKAVIRGFAQKFTEYLNQTLVSEIDKNSLVIKIVNIMESDLGDRHVIALDGDIITTPTDISNTLREAIITNKKVFIEVKNIVISIMTQL